MPTIRPLRDFSEHEVLPTLFTYSGALPVNKGTFVYIVSGASAENTLQQLGDVGAHYQNVVAQRYGVSPLVSKCTNTGSKCVGMTLYDIRETDENGERLILHPDKMERMQAVPSGWPVPILRRGFIQYSGMTLSPTGQGEPLYLSPANDGTVSFSGVAGQSTNVGRIYGPSDSQGFTYIFVDV